MEGLQNYPEEQVAPMRSPKILFCHLPQKPANCRWGFGCEANTAGHVRTPSGNQVRGPGSSIPSAQERSARTKPAQAILLRGVVGQRGRDEVRTACVQRS